MLRTGSLSQRALFHLLVGLLPFHPLSLQENVQAKAVTGDGLHLPCSHELQLVCLGPALGLDFCFESAFWGERK